MSDIILSRLIKDGKVAGYQKQENGKIYHKKNHTLKEFNIWQDISEILHIECCEYAELKNYITHDRVDRWTGIDGIKVFERDRLKIEGIVRLFTVQYHAPAAMWVVIPDLVFIDGEPKREAMVNYIKNGAFKGNIIGIEGVKK